MALARVIAGAGSFLLAVMVFVIMFIKPELADNDLFKSLAQAVVIQGLIGLVMAFLFTGKQGAEGPPAPPQVTVTKMPDASVEVKVEDEYDVDVRS